MKKFLKKSLTNWSVRQDEFGETLWPIKENALAHWLVRQGEWDTNSLIKVPSQVSPTHNLLVYSFLR
ncbi:MAG: hypothetical protein IKY99_10065 [Bacteroidaceae bacterium]|nr:hypothetical protein [Bacteroidaceae bacterium]MBR5612637.1 hypothetical protein [Bacteroidaceae bacterium]